MNNRIKSTVTSIRTLLPNQLKRNLQTSLNFSCANTNLRRYNMSAANEIKALVGATTRYIAGRNAMQTSYWRSAPGSSGRMVKYSKTCEFDRSQKMPLNLKRQYFNRNFKVEKSEF